MAQATYPDLADKNVIVTGGGSGIGAAIVSAFAAQAAKVAFIDIAEEPSRQLVSTLQARGLRTMFVQADLRDIAALRGAIDSITAQHGPTDVLINDAARDDRHAVADVTPAYFDERIAVNLKHVFFAAQAVLPQMVARRSGVIVNFSSTSWMAGVGGMPIYTAAKSAMLGLTRSLARDYGVHNIRVNAIAPGWILTERQKELWITDASEAEMMQEQCLKRWILPEEIANFVVFLCSDAASACTGQHYVVDGGWV